MHQLTWDLGIVAVLGMILAYSLLIRKHKALATLVSVYVSYFIAVSWGDPIAAFFHGDRVALSGVWIKANVTSFNVEVTLLAVFTFLLSTFLKLGGRRSKYSLIEVGAYAVATVALGLVFILLMMPPDLREAALHTSKILPYVYQWRQWVLVVPVFIIIYFGATSEDV